MDAIISHIPPTLFTSPINGTVYAVAGSQWYIAPPDMTLQKLREFYWIDSSKYPQKQNYSPQKQGSTYQIKSSSGKDSYEVKYQHSMWSCTCTGFGYRRKCKHIETIKSKHEKIIKQN